MSFKGKVVSVDARTRKKTVKTKTFPTPPPYKEPEGLDLAKAIKLIKYAEKQGWI